MCRVVLAVCLLLLALGCRRNILEEWPDDPQERYKLIKECLEVGVKNLEQGLAPALPVGDKLERLVRAEEYLLHAVRLDPDGCGSCVWHLAEAYDAHGKFILREADEDPGREEEGKELLRRANEQYQVYRTQFYPGPVGLPELLYSRLGVNYKILGDYRRARVNFRQFLEEAPRMDAVARKYYEEQIAECEREIDRLMEEMPAAPSGGRR